MDNCLISDLYDLISPDGFISELFSVDPRHSKATVIFQGISPAFKGFEIDKQLVSFNLKSTLAQLGMDGEGLEYTIE